MRLILFIQSILVEWIAITGDLQFLDDQERYIKIAMKIEPKDPTFLIRNENAELESIRLNVFNTVRVYYIAYLIYTVYTIFQSFVSLSVSYADHLKHKQIFKQQDQWEHGYLEYYKKALSYEPDPYERNRLLHRIKHHEALRDFSTPSLRQINHLIQIDEKPNLELKEPRCEIYRISLSFQEHSKS